jgi:Pectate lyase superfamily protein
LRPGYEGVAVSDDGLQWRRGKHEPILSVHQDDCGEWEKDCIYQPWLVEHDGRFWNFYNAANGHIEQLGLATSPDMLTWKRHQGNPVVPIGGKDSFNSKFSSDGKIFWDTDHWVCFFFGVDTQKGGGAHIMLAHSRDLKAWVVDPDPIYKAGGNPSGLDKQYAHKISLVWNPANETFYLYYCAVGNKGRGIGLITSKPLAGHSPPTGAGETRAASPPSRVFDARSFGVAGDDATDNTEAFSRCLRAVIEAGGGRVTLPDGVYRGRIIIPPVSRPSPSWITVEITGEHEPTHVFGTIGSFPLQNHGTILKCLDESGPAVISAAKSNQPLYGGFSAVNVVLKNLDVRTYDNPGIGGIDLKDAMQCKLENVFINTGVYNVRASKPTRQTSGLITPAVNNAAWTVLRNVTVTGYHNGIVVNEHSDGDNIVIGSNIHGLNFEQAHHASRFARVSSCRNVNTLTVSGAHGFSIEQLNIEQPGPNQTDAQNHWQTTESDVNDPGNLGVADIDYWVVIGNVGARDVFLKKGGASIQARRIGSKR